MEMNGISYGVPVPGTDLIRHGNAPRKSSTDRNQMAWYECTRCRKYNEGSNFKMIRVQSVRPGHTVSCGCKGSKQFSDYMQQRAANIPVDTQRLVFKLATRARKRLSRSRLAEKFKMSKYLIDFIIAARCAVLRTVVQVGKLAKNILHGLGGLSKLEFAWAARFEEQVSMEELARRIEGMSEEEFLAPLHWRDRYAYKAMVCAEQAVLAKQATEEGWNFHALLQDPTADVQIGFRQRPFIPTEPLLQEAWA